MLPAYLFVAAVLAVGTTLGNCAYNNRINRLIAIPDRLTFKYGDFRKKYYLYKSVRDKSLFFLQSKIKRRFLTK